MLPNLSDLLALFGENAFCVLPAFKRTRLDVSANGNSASATYTARIDTRNWKQKYRDELDSTLSRFTATGVLRTENPVIFNSTIVVDIRMDEDDNRYSLVTYIWDYDNESYSCWQKSIRVEDCDMFSIMEQIDIAKNKLKLANSNGHTARRIITGIASWNINDKPQEILERLPSLFAHPDTILVGDTLTIGHVPNDHESIEAHGNDITWKVLEVDSTNKRALVISEKVLTKMKPYTAATSDNCESYTYSWASCDINTYLNGSFITEYGLSNVSMASVPHETEYYTFADNSSLGTAGTPVTSSEKVFLLSVAETNSYFADDDARAAQDLSGSIAHWWLRSPGSFRCYRVAYVYNLGGVYTGGIYVINEFGLRPAFWINLP